MSAEPAWQELLRLRLVERNSKESAYAHIIEQCTSTSLFHSGKAMLMLTYVSYLA